MDLTPWMERWHMLPEQGGIVLCGVSGGRDSVCLLDYLHKLGQQRGFTAAAGHLNHLMRPTAQRDEDFVRAFCRERGIPFYTERADVYGLCGTWGLTVEETGRRARYEFLQRTAAAIGAARIATAHHRDDLAETVILQLLRGTGPQGLTGIPPVRGNIIRPLLDTSRRDIERYIEENGLTYVTDETNGDTAYARNRLRLEIWPMLEGINSEAAAHIARTADILRRENAYLDELAAARLPETGCAVDCGALLAAPEALRPRMLRLLLERLGTGRKDLGAVHLETLERLAAGEGMLALPGGAEAVCRDGVLTVRPAEIPPEETVLREGENPFGAACILVSRTPAEGGLALRCGPGQVLTARCWRRDDRLMLPGSRGERSVKRLLAERGVTPEKRETIPVLCVDGVTAAVWGVGTDRKFLPEASGEKIYIIYNERKLTEDTTYGKEQYGSGHSEGPAV